MSTLDSFDAGETPWDELHDALHLRVEDYPSALLMRTANLVQTESTSLYAKEHGLTVPEWRLLARLNESAPMQLADLCRTSFFDKAYAGRILRGLEERGLLESHTDEAHKRRLVIHLTAKGRRLARKVEEQAQICQKQVLSTMTQAERRALYQLLKKLIAAVPNINIPEGNSP